MAVYDVSLENTRKKKNHKGKTLNLPVVPGGAILRAFESVSTGLARSKSTLRDSVDSIRSRRVELTDAVPMNASSVVLHGVCYCDAQCVSPICSDDGSRVLVVDQQALLIAGAIGVAGCVGNLKRV